VPDAIAVRILDRLDVTANDVRAALAALGVDAGQLVVTRRRWRRLLAWAS